MKATSANLTRCSWPSNPLSIRYHDEEWGLPQHDDRVLFEFLILEGAQAGLSWDNRFTETGELSRRLRRL
jgi:DNA-3-methyladenine glycosylase I